MGVQMTNIDAVPAVELDFDVASRPSSSKAKAIAQKAADILATSGKQNGIKGLTSGRSDTFRLNPYLIKVEKGWNSRDFSTPENQEHVDNLARSIAEIGVKEPLTVFWKNNAPVLTDGESRLRATLRAIEVYGAEIVSIPVKTEDKGASEADRVMSQIVRNSGKPLTVFEQAKVFKRLVGFGWDVNDIARKAGCSSARVNQLLELIAAPEAIHKMVTEGRVSATLAWQAVKAASSDEEAVETLEKAVENANEQGRARATAKDVEAGATPRVSFKREMKAAFEAARIDNSHQKKVVVEFPADAFEQIRLLLKL